MLSINCISNPCIIDLQLVHFSIQYSQPQLNSTATQYLEESGSLLFLILRQNATIGWWLCLISVNFNEIYNHQFSIYPCSLQLQSPHVAFYGYLLLVESVLCICVIHVSLVQKHEMKRTEFAFVVLRNIFTYLAISFETFIILVVAMLNQTL